MDALKQAEVLWRPQYGLHDTDSGRYRQHSVRAWARPKIPCHALRVMDSDSLGVLVLRQEELGHELLRAMKKA